MEIKRTVTDYLKSNMYLITENGHGLLIDPCFDEKLIGSLKKRDIILDYIILTHEHYDHISGVNLWKEAFPRSEVMCNEVCAERIQNPRANSSRYFEAFCQIQTWAKDQKPMSGTEFVCHADRTFTSGDSVIWQDHKLFFKEAPGHSPGSTLIFLDEDILFSGDSLMRDHLAATRFPGGSTKIYNEQTLPFIMSLSESITVYPGHLEIFKLSECLAWKSYYNEKER